MIAALGLLAALALQQDTMGLSPRARAMLDRFVPPVNGEVTVATRFSDDTVWIGEQVELVTAIWFPRDLRQRLRRQPSLRSPTLAGMWSAPTSVLPELAETRRVSGIVLDLYVSHQTLFPLAAGPAEATPAVLSFAVPSSTSFFAPEERREVTSRSARLVVRPIPAALAARLGSGPTARDMRLRWEAPRAAAMGTPMTVELVLSGRGNVALWPVPDVAWPVGVRVYAEPTEERVSRPGGAVSGEKRFRYTLVADSLGVVTLPRVRYPHFDPARVQVAVATAAPVGVAVRPAGASVERAAVPASTELHVPIAATLVRRWWPALVLLGVLPVFLRLSRRRRPQPGAQAPDAPEARLRALLGHSAFALPGGVARALRRQGATREEAQAIREWLEALERHRWSAARPERPDDSVVLRVLERIRDARVRAALLLAVVLGAAPAGAQWQDALDRYRANDPVAAAHLFEQVVAQHPASPDAWLDLGAARWLGGDDVGSTAAWLQGLQVAPRDGRLHAALAVVPDLPAAVRARVPLVPLSRDELVLLALVAWLAAWATWRRARRVALAGVAVVALAGGLAAMRTVGASRPAALTRPGHALRVSPVITAPELAPVAGWSVASLERHEAGWWLVQVDDGRRGWLAEAGLAPLSRLD